MFLGVPKSMVVRLGWMSVSYGVVQLLRLLTNVILTHLLAPSMLGLMAVVNAIRTGVELLSDVGIMQNIISSPRGDDPLFYDTAWTLQAIRGLVLASVCLALAVPLARFFQYPQLAAILPVASLFFVFTGFDSTARPLTQKQLHVARLSIFDIAIGVVSLVAHVTIALITPTVWALVVGGVVTAAAALIGSFLFIPGLRHRFIIDPHCARQVLSFGRWVFLSSIVYFFAMNFDRLYFARQITLSQLGVYGIARSLADMMTLFVARASSFVLYPTIAAAGLAQVELRQRLLRGRRTLLFAAAVGLGTFLALSEIIIRLLYDIRYIEAAWILPLLCMGVWFAIITSTNDAILMGLARPAYPALSNAAKLITYAVGVPVAFFISGFTAAVAVISAGELVKYIALWLLSRKEHLRFGRDDLVLTLAFAGTAFVVSEITWMLGLGGGLQAIYAHLFAGGGPL